MKTKWQKLGCILTPKPDIKWLSTFAGPSFAMRINERVIKIYVTGRDLLNRSHIGYANFDLQDFKIIEISNESVLELGTKGSFDENGTSYPYLFVEGSIYYMYYTGWIPGVLVPFINDMGLAISTDGIKFVRYSKAPILHRNNDDYLGIGSMAILKEGSFFHMYYTSFNRWGKDSKDHKHYYNIKYACSNNGINWDRFNHVCIDFKNKTEYSIGKPCVLRINEVYHMWYSYRGSFYKIGHAVSLDGRNWKRIDQEYSLLPSETGWDSEMVCYSHVFLVDDYLYMIYNGNNYGQTGLGIARMELAEIINNNSLCNFL